MDGASDGSGGELGRGEGRLGMCGERGACLGSLVKVVMLVMCDSVMVAVWVWVWNQPKKRRGRLGGWGEGMG